MTSDLDIVKQLQREVKNWNLDGKCKVHSWIKQCEYGRQGRVTRLHLCGRGLSQVPSSVWQLSGLQELYLDKNHLSALPAELGNLSGLKKLWLENSPLTTLPAEVGNLSSLKELRLESNQLSTLPAEVGNLSSLEYLYLRDNQFSTLPVELWHLPSLRYLLLANNQFSTLPAEVGNLSSLWKLELDNNQFSTLPAEVGNLSSLRELRLRNNQFSTLPAEIWHLSWLDLLDLSYNQFSTLPAETGNLSSLRVLFLNNNQLSTLPAELWHLLCLQGLYLENNQLHILPAEVGNLSMLNRLNLRSNQFNTLPAELANLSSLEWLAVNDNPLQIPPPEVVGQGMQVICAYLRQSQQTVQSFRGSISTEETSAEEGWENRQETLPLKIFYCYAREDGQLLKELQKHLAILKRLKQAIPWPDREILAGSKWEHEIERHLDVADIILLLMSAAFIDSEYCYSVEMQRALERHRRSEAHVIPIVLRPCSWKAIRWQEMSMSDLQALPENGKPITTWPNRDEAWNDVTEGVKGVVERCFSQKVRLVNRDQIFPKKQKQMDTIQDPQQQEWFEQLRRGLAAGYPGDRAQAAHGIAALANFSGQPVREALKDTFQRELREALHDPSDSVRRAARLALEELSEN